MSGPEERRPGRAASAGRWLALALLAALAWYVARGAYCLAFGHFNFWDDEGYFLLALREFEAHGGLYERIRTVFYGPAYFQMVGALFAFSENGVDHAGARWLLLGGWAIGLAALCWVASRAGRGPLPALYVLALAFPYLAFFTNEPLHATSPLLLLLAPLVCLAHGPLARAARPRPAVLAACGALCAAIALVKLNVGICVVLAFLVALAPRIGGRLGAWLRPALAFALLAWPFVVMGGLLVEAWVLDFALLVALALAPFALRLVLPARAGASAAGAEDPAAQDVGARELAAFLLGFGAVCVLSLGHCFLRGTTPVGLFRSLILDGLEFPKLNRHAPGLPPRPYILASAVLVPLALAWRARAAPPWPARLLASAFVLWQGAHLRTPFAALPCLWLAQGAGQRPPARALAGLLGATTALQAFPIAGSQLGLFSIFTMLAGVAGAADALREARPWLALPAAARRGLAVAALLASACLVWAVNPFWPEQSYWRIRYERGVRLDLPGTGRLRLEEPFAARYRWVAANLAEHAGTFVGVPGMHSFYLWSGRPAPVPFYPHHWTLYRRAGEEEELVRTLLAAERPCVVRNPELEGFWKGLGEGPLASALADFRCAGSMGEYELWFPAAAQPRLVLTASIEAGRADLLARYGARWIHRLTLPRIPGSPVRRLVLCDGQGVPVLDTGALDGSRRLVVTDLEGRPLLEGRGADALDTEAPSELLMLCRPVKIAGGISSLVVRAVDAQGEVVARILFQLPR